MIRIRNTKGEVPEPIQKELETYSICSWRRTAAAAPIYKPDTPGRSGYVNKKNSCGFQQCGK